MNICVSALISLLEQAAANADFCHLPLNSFLVELQTQYYVTFNLLCVLILMEFRYINYRRSCELSRKGYEVLNLKRL